MTLADITPADCQAYVTSKREAGVHPRTINKTIMVLKLMFRHADQWGYIKDNPARYVERPKVPHREMDYLEPSEIQSLFSACEPDLYPIVATAVLTGMRQAELLGLQWGDVDLERGLIFVRRSYHQRHGFDSTKTIRCQRAIYISEGLFSILTEHRESTGVQPGELVFATNGKPIPAASMVRDRFNPTLNSAGLPRIRWHDLRHTYAALTISSGENIKFVSQQMGHTSTRTTWDIYGHLLPEVSHGAGDRLDALALNPKVFSLPRKNPNSAKSGDV